MWQVENTTPFAVAGNWTRDRDGAEVWLIAVRCLFDIHSNGATSISEKQEDPVLGPVFSGEPALSSLISDSDFHLTKPTTDIVLHGHAYAPEGGLATQVDVLMRVGGVRKTLRIFGDRQYERRLGGLGPSGPQPFAKIPIVYERARGGRQREAPERSEHVRLDKRNPAGRGFEARLGDAVANIEAPEATGADGPLGFGPIAPHWSPRVELAGTYDAGWRRRRMPLFPDDLDDRFFLCSPADQRPREHLRGGEEVELRNLTPTGSMRFCLPRVAFRCETRLRGKQAVVHRGAIHSVILEPDRSQVAMVWQSALRIHADVHRLEETHVRQLQILNQRRYDRTEREDSTRFEEDH